MRLVNEQKIKVYYKIWNTVVGTGTTYFKNEM